jgi:hypothetical protein
MVDDTWRVREDSEKSKMGHRDTCSHFSSYRDLVAAVELQPTATSRVPSRGPTRATRRLASTQELRRGVPNSCHGSLVLTNAFSKDRRFAPAPRRWEIFHPNPGSRCLGNRNHSIGTQHPYSWWNAGYMTWLSTHRLLQTVSHSALPGAAASEQLRTNHSAPLR